MFTKRRQPSLFSSRPRRRRSPISRPWLLAALPLGLLGLELLLRIGTGLTGKTAELNAYEGEPPLVTDYRFQPFTSDNQAIQGVDRSGRLAAMTDPLTGYRLRPDQKNAAVTINPQGYRSATPIAVDKPANEVRIMILGGSTAFGSFSANDQIIFSQRLENQLNQQVKDQKNNSKKFRPDALPYFADELDQALKLPPRIRNTNYRVLNAAVPGYISSNTLADLTTRIGTDRPDLIVLIDGYTDLLTATEKSAATLGTESLSADAIGHFGRTIGTSVKGIFDWFYISKVVRAWILRPTPTMAQLVDPLHPGSMDLADRLPQDAKSLNTRIDRYQRNLSHLAQLSRTAKIPLIIALQPELSQRPADRQTPTEKQYLQALGPNYAPRIQAGYQALKGAIVKVQSTHPNTATLNLQPRLDKLNADVFLDPIHLSDPAQQAISDQLREAIVPRLQVEPKPFAG
jgi:hypothetical protein